MYNFTGIVDIFTCGDFYVGYLNYTAKLKV